jgi:hypothetical protein
MIQTDEAGGPTGVHSPIKEAHAIQQAYRAGLLRIEAEEQDLPF